MQLDRVLKILHTQGWKVLLLSDVAASFSPVGLIVAGVPVDGGWVSVVSVKAETSEFQNAIFSGSMFFWMEDDGLNEIYCLSLRVYAGQLVPFTSAVGFLYQIINWHPSKFYFTISSLFENQYEEIHRGYYISGRAGIRILSSSADGISHAEWAQRTS